MSFRTYFYLALALPFGIVIAGNFTDIIQAATVLIRQQSAIGRDEAIILLLAVLLAYFFIQYLSDALKRRKKKSRKLYHAQENNQVSRSLLDTLNPEDRSRVQRYVNKRRKRRKKKSRKLYHAQENNQVSRSLLDTLNPEDRSRVQRYVKAQITQANRQKDLYLANMSHEIRTQLNGIVGFAQLISDTPLNQNQRECINTINNSSSQLLMLVNDILDFAKIQNDFVDIESIPFDLYDVLESAVETYAIKAHEKQITLLLSIDPKIDHWMAGDPTKLTQIITNLLSNAIKLTPNRGDVTIRAVRLDPVDHSREPGQTTQIILSVEDTGPGVSQGQQKQIFDAFSQENASISRKFGGTGLGLAISSKLVKAMGGTLEIEQQEGRGAKFHFTLPLREIEPLEAEHSAASVAYIASPQKVPDEEYKMIRGIIEKYFAVCYYAESLEAYLAEHHAWADYIILDSAIAQKAPFSRLRHHRIILLSSQISSQSGPSRIPPAQTNVHTLLKPLTSKKLHQAIELLNDPEHMSPESEGPYFKDLSVLVAEDNPINQRVTAEMLQSLGIKPYLVAHGREALHAIETETFDLVLMDIEMPVMDGIEAVRRLRTHEREHKLPPLPVIALTANNLKGERNRLISLGMDGFLAKPIPMRELRALLAEHAPHKMVKPLQRTDLLVCIADPLSAKMLSALARSLGYSVDMTLKPEEMYVSLQTSRYRNIIVSLSLVAEAHGILDHLERKQGKKILFLDVRVTTFKEVDLANFDAIMPNQMDVRLVHNYLR
jgi:signal transduction histidine kinase/CheY-like chemotaxis protein